ncbi:Nsp1-like C-terminal region-domain-containing protein [Lentinula raphanica]|nr:Nsp1-like C-terminal region-domain-containing protein [Lentinula raphanica]
MSFFNTGSSSQNTGTTGGGGIFGSGNSSNAGGSTATPSLFGNTGACCCTTSTTIVLITTAANKPAGSIFGSGSGASNTGTNTNLFGSSGNSTSTPTPSLFGGGTNTNTANNSSTSTTANPAPSSNSLFGGGAFSLPKPTDQTKPATSNYSSTPATTTTPALNTGLFGSTAPKSNDNNTSTTSTTTAPSTGLFGGSFFNKPATATTNTQTPGAPSTSSSSSPFSLGGTATASGATPAVPASLFGTKPADPAGGKDKAPSATPGSATGSLFGAPKPEEKKDGAAAGGLFGTSTTTTSTAPAVAIQPPSMLRGKTIEEIVNKWSNELETHVKEFNKFAAEVSVWDRALIENSNNLAAIYSHVLAAEREQAEVDQSLDHIEQQQKDLAATLDAYEKVTEEIFGGQGGSLRALDTGPADTERDKNYMLAADLQTHLDDLSGSLTQMIEAVNGLSTPSGSVNSSDPSANGTDRSQEDPMAQISQILSSHLDSLQWIDGAVREIESKISEVERRVGESGHGLGQGGVAGGGSKFNLSSVVSELKGPAMLSPQLYPSF